MRRGMTLVELMISVALVGILAAGVASTGRRQLLESQAELQLQQAWVWLQYEAECAAVGVSPDPDALVRLEAGVPGHVQRVRDGELVELRLSWQDPLDRDRAIELVVFSGGAR